MNSYLRTIGFSSLQKRRDEKKLLDTMIQNPDRVVSIQVDEESSLTMLEKRLGKNPCYGVRFYGDYDENKNFQTECYIPFVENGNISSTDTCNFTKMAGSDVLIGCCDDYRMGLSLIFTVSNFFDVLRYRCVYKKEPQVKAICLSGMCTEAKVLFPIEKTVQQREESQVAALQRINWMKAAKQGDKDALESLTLDDMNTYNVVSKRIMNEDLYSVIDSFFIPVGVECDQYQMMGDIVECREFINGITHEEMYAFIINANDVDMDVYVNKKDLLGEPVAGRRLKCNMWLQGEVVLY